MSTLFYLEKGCASIEFPEKISKNADYVVRASGRGLEGRLFLRCLGQIDRPGLVFAELIEDGAQVADLVGQLIRAAELDLIAVVIPEGDVIFLFHVERADMFKQPRAVELAEHIERGGERRGRRGGHALAHRGAREQKAVDMRVFVEGRGLDALERLAGGADEPAGVGVGHDGEGDGALPHLDDDAVRQAAGDGNVLDVWKRGLDVADGQRLIDGQEIVAGLDLRSLDDLLGRIDGVALHLDGADLEKDCNAEDDRGHDGQHDQELSERAAAHPPGLARGACFLIRPALLRAHFRFSFGRLASVDATEWRDYITPLWEFPLF